MSSNWGRVTNTKLIGRGVEEVTCEGHGGILVTENAMQTQPFLEKLRNYPDLAQFSADRGGYEFEEDCNASIICYALGKTLMQSVWSIPEDRIDAVWNSIIRSLIMCNPNVYTHMSGVGVSIFESPTLLEQHLAECGHKVYKFYWSYRPSDYELPEGKRIFSVHSVTDLHDTKCFMVSTDEFEQISRFKYLPVDTSNLVEVEAPRRKAVAA